MQIAYKNEPYLALGLLLTGLVPTSGMTSSRTGFAKGNEDAMDRQSEDDRPVEES
jgi:arsenite transporter